MVGRPRKLKEGEEHRSCDRVAAMLLEHNVLEGSQLLRARREVYSARPAAVEDDEDPTWPRPSGYGRVLVTATAKASMS